MDLDGNNLIKLWFTQPTTKLSIQTLAKVETSCTNPFAYLLEPWAINLQFDYPSSLLKQLEPYLQPYGFVSDSSVLELAQDLAMGAGGNTLNFLFELNQRIYQDCEYIIRDTGEPFPSGVTWRTKQGSCRDYAVLFMDVCRAVGIAARFVSGYQEGDQEHNNAATGSGTSPGGTPVSDSVHLGRGPRPGQQRRSRRQRDPDPGVVHRSPRDRHRQVGQRRPHQQRRRHVYPDLHRDGGKQRRRVAERCPGRR